VPAVRPLLRGADLVAATRAATAAGGAVVVLDGSAAEPLRAVRLPTTGEVLIVVGPEGGLTVREVAALAGAGAAVARLGPHVLRTSTAGPVAVALVSERLGRWAGPDAGR
jgi:16S rRNA (uracil1498-N3)-methyltransferase